MQWVGVPRFHHGHQTLLITRDVLVHVLQARVHHCAEQETERAQTLTYRELKRRTLNATQAWADLKVAIKVQRRFRVIVF